MDTDTESFLAAVSFSAGEDNPILDANVHDYHPDLVAAVSKFCGAFRSYCQDLGLDPDYDGEDHFGHNVFFSLSGHGCGFWDDSGPWGDVFQAALENFAGSKYLFEELAWNLDWEGEKGDSKIHLSFLPQYLAEYLQKYFGIPDVATLPPLAESVTVAIGLARAEGETIG